MIKSNIKVYIDSETENHIKQDKYTLIQVQLQNMKTKLNIQINMCKKLTTKKKAIFPNLHLLQFVQSCSFNDKVPAPDIE